MIAVVMILLPTDGVVTFIMSHNVSFTTILKWEVEGSGKNAIFIIFNFSLLFIVIDYVPVNKVHNSSLVPPATLNLDFSLKMPFDHFPSLFFLGV